MKVEEIEPLSDAEASKKFFTEFQSLVVGVTGTPRPDKFDEALLPHEKRPTRPRIFKFSAFAASLRQPASSLQPASSTPALSSTPSVHVFAVLVMLLLLMLKPVS